MKVSSEYIIPNIWENKIHVPNHQHTKKNSVPSVSPSFPLSEFAMDDAAGSPSLVAGIVFENLQDDIDISFF